jgi:4-diphosphocytidyl-2-C-methyl-D-erythritol kinase
MRGVGERLGAVPPLPAFELVLVNPRVAVSTAAVFAGLTRKDNPPMPDTLPGWPDLATFCDWLGQMRNDLADPARAIAPVIDDCLDALRGAGCGFAGMSGSGATCFGIVQPGHAETARARIAAAQPGWWVAAGPLS